MDAIDLSDLPKRLLEDRIAKNWATEFRRRELAGDVISLWTPAQVDERIVDAVRLVERIGGPTGPKVFGRGWPQVAKIYEALNEFDLVELDSLPNDPEDVRPSRATISAQRVSEMEAALHWPARYLKTNQGCRNVFNLWLRCKAHRKNFRKACAKAGWNEATSKRRRWQASMLIASGLMADGAASPPQLEDYPRD